MINDKNNNNNNNNNNFRLEFVSKSLIITIPNGLLM